MNKILSQAIRKAVSDYTPNVNQDPKDKRLDLFSLNSETELFQNSKGITIKIDRSRDDNLTDFGKATLKDRYLGANESFQDCLLELQAIMLMTTCTLKDYIITLVIFGSCQQHQFYLMEEPQEDCQYLVF
jgi:hypothetical protein